MGTACPKGTLKFHLFQEMPAHDFSGVSFPESFPLSYLKKQKQKPKRLKI